MRARRHAGCVSHCELLSDCDVDYSVLYLLAPWSGAGLRVVVEQLFFSLCRICSDNAVVSSVGATTRIITACLSRHLALTHSTDHIDRPSSVGHTLHEMCSKMGAYLLLHYPVLGLKISTQATMAPSKEDGTAAAAQQLGSISLCESAERKNNKTEPNAKNGTPAKMCSACEEKSDALMKCRACKCVWYCDKDCQNKHWKEHKKECKRIKKELDKRGGKLDLGDEMDIGPLGKLPPRDECPICMRALPIHTMLRTYSTCCGKTICGGCNMQHSMKSREQGVRPTCAFCRTAAPRSGEEDLVLLKKRIEKKDPQAMLSMAMHYGYGQRGLPVDQAMCVELLRQSTALGYPGAYSKLGDLYYSGEVGLEQNGEEALKFWHKAAEGGHLSSLHNLGCRVARDGDRVAAMRYWRLSASAGYKLSMGVLIGCFENWRLLHHADLAETLQAFCRSRGEMKSEEREQWIKHLKKIGKYDAEYDL